MIYLFYYFPAMICVIFLHELGHMLVALAVGIKCEVFSLGFGKPALEKTIWGIKFRITPWLIGGYVRLDGEGKTNEWIFAPYSKKLVVVLAGVAVNLVTAVVCYLVMYKSVIQGVTIDWMTIKAIFTKDYLVILEYIYLLKAHPFLVQLSLLSLFACLTNILPLIALDGGYVWLFWSEKLFKNKKTYVKVLNIVVKISFWLLIIGQLVLVYWLYFKDMF